MSIQMTTPLSAIDAYIAQQLQRQEKAIINILNYVGIACINEGRTNGAYNDITGNLRSSIGYVVVKDGQIVNGSAFDQNEGGGTGQDHIQKIIAKFPKGIVLIVVAGMNYASYVEAMSLNVLTSSELLAEKLVPQLLKQLAK